MASELEVIEKAIVRLPYLTRQVFVLSRFDNLSYGQISERLGIPASRVEKRLAAVLTKVRRARRAYAEGREAAGS